MGLRQLLPFIPTYIIHGASENASSLLYDGPHPGVSWAWDANQGYRVGECGVCGESDGEILAHRVGGVYLGEMSHTHINSFLIIWQLQLL